MIKTQKQLYFPVVKSVVPGSLAYKTGIRPYDSILQINGEKPDDTIDYRYLVTDEMVIFELKSHAGKRTVVTIEKEIDQDVGIEFFPIKCRTCSNNCIFCFIDQNPGNLRPDLYVKDEDYRMSFLLGNYITLTTPRKKDIRKIIQRKLSPLYISVHSVDKELRNRILGNQRAPDILPILKSLAKHEIVMHTQIVLMPEINDKKHLDKSILSLAKLYPSLASIAVVPVGLTKYRQNLPKLEQVSKECASHVIDQIEQYQEQFYSKCNDQLVYLADEFYLLAGKEFPPVEMYGSFDQIENGIGIVQQLLQEFRKIEKDKNVTSRTYDMKADIVCGVLVAPVLKPIIKWLNNMKGVQLSLFPVKNRFFGESVTVTGLLTGSDIIKQLKGSKDNRLLLIPDVMLKHDETVFLDNYTVSGLSETLNRPVQPFNPTVKNLLKLISGPA